MSASPAMIAAFKAWTLAELATHYASPCPDEIMDGLNDMASKAEARLLETPPETADDLLLKLFPFIIAELHPVLGEPPMRPSATDHPNHDDAFASRLSADLAKVSPQLRELMDLPELEGSMSPHLIGTLFGSAFVAAAWALVTSIAPQLHRFRELIEMEDRV